MRRNLTAAVLSGVLAVSALAGCGGNGDDAGSGSGDGGDGKITLGFSQVGAESGWRTANTKSIQESAKEAGIDLQFSDAQGKQENQISAIRNFITQKVDVIAFSPVVTSGWDAVLKEAKDADIPVILTDRAVDSQDKSLYKSFIGSTSSRRARRPASGWSSSPRASPARSTSSSCRAPRARRRPSTGRRASPRPSRPTRT